MIFQTLPRFNRPDSSSPDGAYLEADSWNDYGFRTLWTLLYLKGGHVTEIGAVKIGDIASSI
ncbi:phage phiHau3 resistance protein [Mycolicibacterium fortuitum subsp. acetamidolyticum]|uniref:Phage phiHau3 resistance protein n=1 Tax=Mycolicibacterium fortuitum subsp. acetamidolyticum TaxID=144550 RepID=A0A100WTM2_MYCFO|nr:phage phiHau3 resistance protein [Mycolicibacterium fortuitum subsp. acetamidolyticum]